jgi:hypothetical protein
VFGNEEVVSLVWALVLWVHPGAEFVDAVKEGAGCSQIMFPH